MSLGGKGFFGLEDEIQEAVDSGMIVMAAAGEPRPDRHDACQLRQLPRRRGHRAGDSPLGRLVAESRGRRRDARRLQSIGRFGLRLGTTIAPCIRSRTAG
jgi:hypothetical protein